MSFTNKTKYYSKLDKKTNFNIIYPKIELIKNKIISEQYFTFTKYSIEWWMTIKKTFEEIGYENMNVKYMSSNNFAKKLANVWEKKQKRNRPWKISPEGFGKIIQSMVLPKPENMWFGIADRGAFNELKYPFELTNRYVLDIARKILPKKEKNIVNASCWKYWAYTGEIHDIMTFLKKRKVVIVGPYYLKTAGYIAGLKNFTHITIDHKEAMLHYDNYKKEIYTKHKKYVNNHKNVVYLLQGGAFAIQLSYDMANDLNNAFVIDIGRAIDVYLFYHNIRKTLPSNMWGTWLTTNKPEWLLKLHKTK